MSSISPRKLTKQPLTPINVRSTAIHHLSTPLFLLFLPFINHSFILAHKLFFPHDTVRTSFTLTHRLTRSLLDTKWSLKCIQMLLTCTIQSIFPTQTKDSMQWTDSEKVSSYYIYLCLDIRVWCNFKGEKKQMTLTARSTI